MNDLLFGKIMAYYEKKKSEDEPVCPKCGKPKSDCVCENDDEKKKSDKEVKESLELINDALNIMLEASENANDAKEEHKIISVSEASKEYKKALKDNDFTKAAKSVNDMEETVKRFDKNTSSLNDIGEVKKALNQVIVTNDIMTVTVGTGIIGNKNFTDEKRIEMISKLVQALKNSTDKVKAESKKDDIKELKNTLKADLNIVYKVLAVIKGNVNIISKLKDAADKKDKVEKSKVVKESVDKVYNKFKAALYESCANGEITLEQREDLLAKFESDKAVSESIDLTEARDADISLKAKFSMVKKDIYERCANGEFDENTRERLLETAYDRIYETTMPASPIQSANAKPEASAIKDISKVADKINVSKDIEKDTKQLTNDISKMN